MSILKINTNNINDIKIREIINDLNLASAEIGIDYYVIGAKARDFWFEANNISQRRFTQDIDFAVLVSDLNQFQLFIKLLVEKFGFRVIEKLPYRVIYIKHELTIDLLPFGGVNEAGYINFMDKFDTQISILGLEEVYKEILKKDYNDKELKIASLPGLCILKLVSWSDKPESRNKDIEDINIIIQNYFDIMEDEIFEIHNDIFDNENFDRIIAGARVLGRNMIPILNHSVILKTRILTVLNENIDIKGNCSMAKIMIRGTNKNIEDCISLINEIILGINDKI